nr:hypothetical protein [Candidatus Sigynarchaeum springense]
MPDEIKADKITTPVAGVSFTNSSGNLVEPQSDEPGSFGDVHHVSRIVIKKAGEIDVPFMDLVSRDGLSQWVPVEGHFDLQFGAARECIECNNPITIAEKNNDEKNDDENNDGDGNGTTNSTANSDGGRFQSIACNQCKMLHLDYECQACEHRLLRAFARGSLASGFGVCASCKLIEQARVPDRWWPWCLDDHAIIINFQEASPVITWSIERARDAQQASRLLEGACRVVLERDGAVLDLPDAMAIMHGFNTSGLLDDAAPAGQKHPVHFIPEWQHALDARILELLHRQARARKDGGLWLASLAWSKHHLVESLTQGFRPDNRHHFFGTCTEITGWVDFLRGFVAHARSTTGIELAVASVHVDRGESLVPPIPDDAVPGDPRSFQGDVVAHHGSICVVQQGTRHLAIDLRDLVGRQPRSIECLEPPPQSPLEARGR